MLFGSNVRDMNRMSLTLLDSKGTAELCGANWLVEGLGSGKQTLPRSKYLAPERSVRQAVPFAVVHPTCTDPA